MSYTTIYFRKVVANCPVISYVHSLNIDVVSIPAKEKSLAKASETILVQSLGLTW